MKELPRSSTQGHWQLMETTYIYYWTSRYTKPERNMSFGDNSLPFSKVKKHMLT